MTLDHSCILAGNMTGLVEWRGFRVHKRSVLELQRLHSVDEKTLMVRAVENEASDKALSTVTNRKKGDLYYSRSDWLFKYSISGDIW